MTSDDLAQPRPQRPASTVADLVRQRSISSSVIPTLAAENLSGNGGRLMYSDIDDRPTKRRRVGSESLNASPIPRERTHVEEEPQSQQVTKKYSGVDWVAALSGRTGLAAPTKTDLKNTPPLPPPPWFASSNSDATPGRIRTACRYRVDIAVPNVPDYLKRTSDVPILEPKKPLDYFPWSGNHPEDIINESNVKNGWWDRAPHPSEKELNTAKAPLYNAFKHRRGLESLSALFSLVLDQKFKHGGLSSISTFRPPPRVTLTEAKRRSWIADLADENVTLKRLSRTIPQGVRGLPLLEQCLLWKIPINRAVWFIKCVGANEIRTLKRKGVSPSVTIGAEHKWLKDWSVSVEQFLETAIGQCGQQRWQDNLRYCLQLCTRLYQENLVARDHFLEWLIKSFGYCSLELLAAWLPLIQIHRLDLIRFRKRAKQLAAAFVARFQELHSLAGAQSVLVEKLRGAIRGLAIFKPACFLMPELWLANRDTVRSSLDLNNERERRLFEHLEKRNARLMGTYKDKRGSNVDKVVFDCLDGASVPFNVQQLSQKLLSICEDSGQLAKLCLRWATSKYRSGLSRVFLVVRLLRRWLKAGFGLDSVLLTFFSCGHDFTTIDLRSFRHLFAELSRSRSFSCSRFLHALSVNTMTASRHDEVENHSTPATRNGTFLLWDMCLLGAAEHNVNLRNHLSVKMTGTTADTEASSAVFIEAVIKALSQAELESDPSCRQCIDIDQLRKLGWSMRIEISHWIRGQANELSKRTIIEVPGKPPLPGSKPFTLSQFSLLRDVLETLEDSAVLADVLHVLSSTKQEDILAAQVDTINCNAPALSAIGALCPLQKLYGEVYVSLRGVKPSMLLFATALLDLCQQYPSQITPIRALQQDLVRGDRGRALAACSPFSDGVAESLQHAGATFIDDFEAILQGEPNMNEQTMTSLFTVLIGRIMKSDGEAHGQSIFTLCQLVARLRLFRVDQGDALVKKWLSRLFSAAWSPTHHALVLELLYTRCVTVETLLTLADQAPAAAKCKAAIRDLVVAGMLSIPIRSSCEQHAYVVKVAAKRLMFHDPWRALELLLSKNSGSSDVLVACTEIMARMLGTEKDLSSLPSPAITTLSYVIDAMMAVEDGEQDILGHVVARADWLSLPLCRLRLALIKASQQKQLKDDESTSSCVKVLKRLGLKIGMQSADAQFVQALLEVLPAEIEGQVRALVEEQFFETLPKTLAGKTNMQMLNLGLEDKSKSKEAVEKVITLGPTRVAYSVADSNGMLIEKLTVVAKLLGTKADVTIEPSSGNSGTLSPMPPAFPPAPSSTRPDGEYRDNILEVLEYLDMLLQVTSMKAGLFSAYAKPTMATTSKQVQNEQIKLVALLASIVTQPSLIQLLQSNIDGKQKTKVQDGMSFALDVAARLADDLSDEARILCARVMKERLRDERIQWLVGSMSSCANLNNPGGHGLVLMHETKGVLGDFRPKQWEMLESGGGKESDTCLGLGLFAAQRV